MRVPLSWLADYVDIELTVDELAHRLTMSGLKVEAVERVGDTWENIVIGQVVEIEPHPSSRNPLWVTRTDMGGGRMETIVTGAPNVKLHDRVPVIPVGAFVPFGPDGEPMEIKPRPMAGITSQGMLASARELGISEAHEGIYILPEDAPVGTLLRTYMGDEILEIETNPNRPDTLSIIGIAREVAAITEQQLTLPDLDAPEVGVEQVDRPSIEIDVEDPALCPRYSALRISGVGVGESPFWMQRRLEGAGMRPINTIVDITNYVMLEYGQPMHAFDAAELPGGRIGIRRARPGETLVTLDGQTRELEPTDLVISDGERAIGLAGVMGGENSEIGDDTTELLLESANFDPISVRRTAKRLDLRTEASARFEKGLPPELTVMGLRRYLQLLAQVSPGSLTVSRISDVHTALPSPPRVTLPLRDLKRLLGIEVGRDEAMEILSLLGFDVEAGSETITAAVPFWRRADIALPADLVEEVARIIGFDRIPATLPEHTVAPPSPLPVLRWEDVSREALRAGGASELVTHTLTAPASTDRLSLRSPQDAGDRLAQIVANPAGVYEREALVQPVPLLNPPTRDRTVLRMTLVPSLLDEVARNLRHTDQHLAFFEIARTYFRRPSDLPYERRTLAMALSGRRQPSSWQDPEPGPYTFFDVKGLLEGVLDALGICDWSVAAAAHPALHPGRSAHIRVGAQDVGYMGELHPLVAERFEIEGWPVQVAEIDLDAVFPHASDIHVFHPIPRHPAAHRDIAVIVGRATPAAEVMRVVRDAGGDLLESAHIFDVYEGEQAGADAKSIAVALDFRAPGATLTQDEVSELMERVVGALRAELNAGLRE
jgi:phenylalanyl-tRNA synthetase beta chain